MQQKKWKNKSGFSLVEIAIVLIIISLLVAGSLKGAELIATSRLQGIAREIEGLKVSVMSFKVRFKNLPGDFDEAEEYDLCTTCNGDGDGIIAAGNEAAYMWDHLEGADIVSYQKVERTSGVGTCATLQSDSDHNFEASDYSVQWTDDEQNKLIHITDCSTSTATSSSTVHQFEGAFTAADAKFVDLKADDGDATSGTILGASDGTSSGCTTASTATLVDYDPSNQDVGCSLSIVYKDW